jgi:hypothetical protein
MITTIEKNKSGTRTNQPQSQSTIPVAVVLIDEKNHKTRMTVRSPDGLDTKQNEKAIGDAWKAAAAVAAEYHAAWLKFA